MLAYIEYGHDPIEIVVFPFNNTLDELAILYGTITNEQTQKSKVCTLVFS